MGAKSNKVGIVNPDKQANQSWSFFHAGLLTAFENPVTYKLAANSHFHLKYSCEAHRLALMLENDIYFD